MRCTLILLIFCVMIAPTARAGAWLREPETAYSSITVTARQLNGIWQSQSSLYGEYGLKPRLTLGLDVNEIPGIAGHALVFARLPIGPAGQRTKIALELGIGGHHRQGQWGSMVKSTVSVGRGFSGRWGNGWFNIDAALELRHPDPDPAFKLDATLGLKTGHLFQPLLKIESTRIAGNTLIWSVMPGALIDGPNNTKWLIGLERKSAAQTSIGLKLGVWRWF